MFLNELAGKKNNSDINCMGNAYQVGEFIQLGTTQDLFGFEEDRMEIYCYNLVILVCMLSNA